jgi:hypothetical protein
MADTIDINQIDQLNDKIKNLSNDSAKIRRIFSEIGKETDLFGKGFEKIVNTARNTNSLAEKYLISQKLQESVQSKINEIKQKSSYLDAVGLQAKRDEVLLQNKIAKAQIIALQQSKLTGLAKDNAINSLKTQLILQSAEFGYYNKNQKTQGKTVDLLNQQLENLENISPSLVKNNKLAEVFSNLFGEKLSTELIGSIAKMGDFGKKLSELKFPDGSDILKKGVTNFLEYDKAAFGLRKSLGLLRGDFDVLQNNVKTVGIELQDLGVSFEQVAASTTAIANEFNMFVASSKALVADVSVISTQLGIAEADSVKFLKTMSSIGKTTVASQKGMMGFAQSMANAAGVPLPAVMKDVAEASDDVRIFTGRSADNLVKGAIQARQMGTTLQNMANSAKKMLDFQTSIADEMEASVLLGKDVNFQQARNLAYRKDIVGANEEILRISKQVDFDAMDPYQAEAFAKASGKSVQELQEMLQADKEIEYIRRNGTVEQKAQLEKMEQMKRMRADEAKDVGKMAEQRLREQANQERINQLQNQFNKLMSELAGPVMDVVEPLLELTTAILPPLLNGMKMLVLTSGLILTPWLLIIKPINAIVKTLQYGKSFMGALAAGGKSLGRSFNFFGRFSGFLGTFAKFLGPIGVIVTAFQAISGFIKGFTKTEGGFFKKMWGGLLGGLQAVVKPILDLLLWPFQSAKEWLYGKLGWLGNSPSGLGLSILDGIKSVGGMLLDALTLPFRTAFNFVTGLFGGPKLPKMSDVVFGNKEKSGADTAKGTDLGTMIAEGNKQVVAKLDELITLMSNGGIAVNIDGTKASMLLAKAQKERGAFGAI